MSSRYYYGSGGSLTTTLTSRFSAEVSSAVPASQANLRHQDPDLEQGTGTASAILQAPIENSRPRAQVPRTIVDLMRATEWVVKRPGISGFEAPLSHP